MDLKTKYIAICKDGYNNTVKLENLMSENKEQVKEQIRKFNPKLRVITILTYDEVEEIKNVLNGK